MNAVLRLVDKIHKFFAGPQPEYTPPEVPIREPLMPPKDYAHPSPSEERPRVLKKAKKKPARKR